MLPRSDRVARCCAADVLVLVSVLVCALATGTIAQTGQPPGEFGMLRIGPVHFKMHGPRSDFLFPRGWSSPSKSPHLSCPVQAL